MDSFGANCLDNAVNVEKRTGKLRRSCELCRASKARCIPSRDEPNKCQRYDIQSLDSKDMVLIAGKGHENTQITGDKTLPFDDAEVARHAVVHYRRESETHVDQ